MPSNSFTLTESQSRVLIAALLQPNFGKPRTYASHRNGLMASLMLDAGLRVGEVTHLTIDDLLAACGTSKILYIRAEITKTNQSREVPLTPTLANLIAAFLPLWQEKWNIKAVVWAFIGSNPLLHITTRQIRRIIGTVACAHLGVAVHPHQLRHTFATRLMKHTNIRIVQKLLGHKRLTSTQIYTHPSTEDCRDAIDNLEPKRGTCRPH